MNQSQLLLTKFHSCNLKYFLLVKFVYSHFAHINISRILILVVTFCWKDHNRGALVTFRTPHKHVFMIENWHGQKMKQEPFTCLFLRVYSVTDKISSLSVQKEIHFRQHTRIMLEDMLFMMKSLNLKNQVVFCQCITIAAACLKDSTSFKPISNQKALHVQWLLQHNQHTIRPLNRFYIFPLPQAAVSDESDFLFAVV